MFGTELSYKEKPAYGIIKRLRRRLLSIFNRWHREGYDVRYVYINKNKFKKVIFRTEANSERIYQDLKAFGPSRHFPTVIGKHRSTLWVEFVQGDTIRNVDTHALTLLADFYAAIYKRDPQLATLRETAIWHTFLQDLCFLHDVKILNQSLHRELMDANGIIPSAVWIGFDYTDPITANIVLRQDKNVICAIDIKNLYSGVLIGRGIAKARSRWLSDKLTESFFEQLTLKGAPDFRAYLPFLEMLNQVTRAKSMVLRGQMKSLRPAGLNQCLEGLIQQAKAAYDKPTRLPVERQKGAGDYARIDATGRPAR